MVWSGQETPDNYAGLLKLGDWCILLPMQCNAMVVENMFFFVCDGVGDLGCGGIGGVVGGVGVGVFC